MKIEIYGHDQLNAVQNTALLFFPLSSFADDTDGRRVISRLDKNTVHTVIEDNGRVTENTLCEEINEKCPEAALVSKSLFKAGCEHCGVTPSWGTITGIRAAKFIRQKQKLLTDKEIEDIYCVKAEKIKLCQKVNEREDIALGRLGKRSVSLYISIPFCPSRCSYCSFVSHSIETAGELIGDYVDTLCEEITCVAALCERAGVYVSGVYMGGGTPTTLTADQLDKVLSKVNELFDSTLFDEFTVEAGRPDTITEEKLDVLIKNGVTRISINPQTMNDDTLVRIGRRHTAKDIEDVYALARTKGFECINMDLIAGLDGEQADDFERTLDKICAMHPENVTVHTLSVKRAAALREKGEEAVKRALVTEKMTSLAQDRLQKEGYVPYYLYKQKNMVGNLENVGYSLKDKDGLYNIYIMGEYQTIAAVGAGAVSKVVDAKTNAINRVFNYKYPYEYLSDKTKMHSNLSELEMLIKESL